MKPLITLFMSVMLALGGVVRSETPPVVSELKMPITDYIVHVHGGLVAGRHHAPVAFRVEPDRRISSLVSGTSRHGHDQTPLPSGDELVTALRDGKTIGFTDAEVRKLGPGFLKTLDAGLVQAPGSSPSEPVIVLVRNTPFGKDEAQAIFTARDEMWEAALRERQRMIDPKARLLIIRLEFPEQQAPRPMQTHREHP